MFLRQSKNFDLVSFIDIFFSIDWTDRRWIVEKFIADRKRKLVVERWRRRRRSRNTMGERERGTRKKREDRWTCLCLLKIPIKWLDVGKKRSEIIVFDGRFYFYYLFRTTLISLLSVASSTTKSLENKRLVLLTRCPMRRRERGEEEIKGARERERGARKERKQDLRFLCAIIHSDENVSSSPITSSMMNSNVIIKVEEKGKSLEWDQARSFFSSSFAAGKRGRGKDERRFSSLLYSTLQWIVFWSSEQDNQGRICFYFDVHDINNNDKNIKKDFGNIIADCCTADWLYKKSFTSS